MTEQQKVIEKIRSQWQGTAETLEVLQSSLKIISEKIYAETTHFIFELIQNADDNSYPNEENAFLSFSILDISLDGKRQKCLIVGNNEIGFQEDQIQAICTIDKSTKKNDASRIGEKGIGFKSVFAVTECPYIFSNGYHFGLPQETEICGTKLGYIVPQWVDSAPAECTETTNIVLPIKDQGTLDKIIEELKSLSPETILFLRKLHRITISIDLDDEQYLNEIIREEKNGTPIVDLICLENQGEDVIEHKTSYLYQSKELTKPENLFEKSRAGIQTRTLTIAIPLCENNDDGGQIFAYLPVQSGTGFPFLVNADFVLTSARDELVKNEWNQWLCGEIPNFYADIVEQAMSSSVLTKEQKISIFSRIPVSSYDPRFSEIIDMVHAELKQRKILLTFQSDILASPAGCQRLGQDKRKILEVLNWTPEYMGERAEEYLFLSTELSGFKDILEKLDVKDNQNSILPCFTEKLLLKIENQQLLKLYQYLIRAEEEVEDTPLIPVLSNQKKCFVSAKKAAVFWERPKDRPPIFPQMNVFFVLKGFYDYIHSLYEDKEKLDELKKQLSELLGINNFSIPSYCTRLTSVLNSYFRGTTEEFIKISHFLIENSVYPKYFVTNKGIVTTNEEIKYIVVSEDFDPEYGWQKIWKNESDRGHFAYLIGYSKEVQQKLLETQKIDQYPLFDIQECNYNNLWGNPMKKEYKDAYDRTRYQKRKMTLNYPEIPRSCYECYEVYFHFLCYFREKPGFFTKKERYCINSVQCSLEDISAQKKAQLGLYYFINAYKSQNALNEPETHDSKLLIEMRQKKWIKINEDFYSPQNTWIQKNEIYSIFGDSVPYISQKISSDLAQVLGIHISLTLDDIFSILEQMNKENSEISLTLAETLYRKIRSWYPDFAYRDEDVRTKIKNFFQQNKSIYIPDSPRHWYSADECYWKENRTFGNEYQYLEKYYSDEFRSFFCDKIGIQEDISPKTYLSYWLRIQAQGENISEEAVKLLYQEVFSFYDRGIYIYTDKDWDSFFKNAKLLTKDGHFVDRQYFLINDNQSLYEIFSDASELIWHVQIEDYPLSELEKFYQRFGVKNLSRVVECTPKITHTSAFNDVTTDYLTPACIAMIATWFYEQKGRHLYNKVLPLLNQLRDTVIGDIGELIPVVYSLSIADKKIVREAETCAYWDTDTNIIYANCDGKHFERQLADCIAKELLPNENIRDFSNSIEHYLGEDSLDRIELDRWGIPDEFRDLVGKERRIQHGAEPVSLTESSDSLPQNAEEAVGEKVLDAEAPAASNEKTFAVEQINYPEAFNNAIPLTGSENASPIEEDDDYEPDEPASEVLEHRSAKRQERFTQQAVNSMTVSKATQNDETCPFERLVPSEKLNRKSRDLLRKCWNTLPPETQLLICHPIDPKVRIFLEDEYQGKCQICGKTFKKKDGHPYFVVTYFVKRDNGGESDTGNAICLCPEHFAQWQYAELERTKDFSELIEDANQQGKTEIPLKLTGKEISIHYTKKHFNDLQDLFKKGNNE